MNDDRLITLLSAAADLRPSPDLDRRVRSDVPMRRSWRSRVGRGIGFGLALSGAAGVATVLVLALLPRESSASGLLQRAAENQARSGARLRAETFVNGRWRLSASGILAPGWERASFPSGGLALETPDGRYERSHPGGPVYRVLPEVKHGDEGFRLADHLHFLRRLGKDPVMKKDEPHLEGGRRVQRVTILVRPQSDRETFTIDVDADLPIALLGEEWVGGRWVPSRRLAFEYPGPKPGAPEFWAGIDRASIVDTEALARLWQRRLTPVLRRLPLDDGTSLAVRDLRILPTGDVLMLYTGPADLKARLVGVGGTRYVRVPFPLNDPRRGPQTRTPITPDGAPLRGLWFTPEKKEARGDERVRLEVLGTGERPKGTFTLQPVRELAIPGWAEAIDYERLATDPEGCREDARLIATYDRWLDAKGQRVPGTYQLAPREGERAEFDPPRPGFRRDPKAAAAAAVAFRRMMARAKAEGEEINPRLVESWLGRFEREAGGLAKP